MKNSETVQPSNGDVDIGVMSVAGSGVIITGVVVTVIVIIIIIKKKGTVWTTSNEHLMSLFYIMLGRITARDRSVRGMDMSEAMYAIMCSDMFGYIVNLFKFMLHNDDSHLFQSTYCRDDLL